jgi:hypothetical protein
VVQYSTPQRGRRVATAVGQSKKLVIGDSTENDFTVLVFPGTEVQTKNRTLLVDMVQLLINVPFANDYKSYRLFLHPDGQGCTLQLPRIPSLHQLGTKAISKVAKRIHARAEQRDRAFVDKGWLVQELNATCNFLSTAAAAAAGQQSDSLIESKSYTFVGTNGEKLRCSMDHFNSPNVKNELESFLTMFGVRVNEDSKQDVYYLAWNLCLAKQERVVSKADIEEIDERAGAIKLGEDDTSSSDDDSDGEMEEAGAAANG